MKYQLCSVLTWEKAKLRPVKKSSVLLGDCSPVPVQIYSVHGVNHGVNHGVHHGVNHGDGDGGDADSIK